MAKIVIKDWGAFKKHNEEIAELIEKGASDVADFVTNVNNITAFSDSVNESFDNLKTEEARGKIPKIDLGKGLKNAAADLSEYFTDKSVKVLGVLSYAEHEINEYNKTIDTDVFKAIMQGSSDIGVYWVVHEATKNKLCAPLTFLLVYGTDAKYEGGDFVVGDGTSKLAGMLLENTSFRRNLHMKTVRLDACPKES